MLRRTIPSVALCIAGTILISFLHFLIKDAVAVPPLKGGGILSISFQFDCHQRVPTTWFMQSAFLLTVTGAFLWPAKMSLKPKQGKSKSFFQFSLNDLFAITTIAAFLMSGFIGVKAFDLEQVAFTLIALFWHSISSVFYAVIVTEFLNPDNAKEKANPLIFYFIVFFSLLLLISVILIPIFFAYVFIASIFSIPMLAGIFGVLPVLIPMYFCHQQGFRIRF